MAENTNNPGANPPPGGGQPEGSGLFNESIHHVPMTARVPDTVAQGIFSSGAIVMEGPGEFVLDFLQGLTRPRRIAARVVMTPVVMEQFAAALRENLRRYEQSFGPPPALPKPPTERRPTIQEIYDEFKLPEEMLSGVYANAVMIGHSPSEFFLDFITRFYPTAAVSARVFVSAAQAPRVLETLNSAIRQYQQRQGGQQNPPAPGNHPQGPQGK